MNNKFQQLGAGIALGIATLCNSPLAEAEPNTVDTTNTEPSNEEKENLANILFITLGISWGIGALVTGRQIHKQQLEKEIDARIHFMYYQLHRECMREHPEMKIIKVETVKKYSDSILAHFSPPHDNQAPSIVLTIPSYSNYKSLFKERASSVARIAEYLGLTIEDLKHNPELLVLFVIFHEFGHAHKFIYNLNNKHLSQKQRDQLEIENRKKELNSLPLPGFDAGEVREMFTSGELEQIYENNSESFIQKGINSPEELCVQQDLAYRNLPSESYADLFAAMFLKRKLSISAFRTGK